MYAFLYLYSPWIYIHPCSLNFWTFVKHWGDAVSDPYFAPSQTHPLKNILRGHKIFFRSLLALNLLSTKSVTDMATKDDQIQQPQQRFLYFLPSHELSIWPPPQKPSCYFMFPKNQLAGCISACKWNHLFPWNLQDLKDISPLPACVTWSLPALTFDKKGRLQLPAASQHQTVTFQTTVNFTDL